MEERFDSGLSDWKACVLSFGHQLVISAACLTWCERDAQYRVATFRIICYNSSSVVTDHTLREIFVE